MELTRPLLRGVSHRWAFLVALGAGPTLVAMSRGASTLAPIAIYAVALAALFGISARYHGHRGPPRARERWQRADHAMIFTFIAATYTPIGAIGVGGSTGAWLLGAVWIGAGLGAAQALWWVDAPRGVTAALYVALGWTMVAFWPSIRGAFAAAPLVLLLVGGALFTVGAVIYALRRPDPRPHVFGYHEVFHVLVIAGCACHFAMILLLVRG